MTVIKLFIRFLILLFMFTATRLCYGDNSELPSSQEEVDEVLKRLNKPPIKSIKSPDGDIIDCVNIYHQPAFDHPLLKSHTIKMEPDYYPTSISVDDIKTSSMMNVSKDECSSSSITQLWHSSGTCPKGTIPIRRTTKEDVLRANSVKNYGKKKGYSVNRRQSLIDTELDDDFEGFGFATAYARGELYGTQATLNVWNPKIGESHEYSMSKIWIVGCMPDDNNALEDINIIEAGWQVYPQMYGDTNTRLFIYWTADGYQTTGCCNHDCHGFVQTNNKIALGGSLSPVSEIDGSQTAVTILIWKGPKTGDWWMQLNGDNVGYWPSDLFSHLQDGASLIEWGGVVADKGLNGRHTTTQMGSGQFPQQGFRKASYIRNIQTVDGSNTFVTPNLESAQNKGCYEILTRFNNDSYWGAHFYFGGPGRNTNCP